MTTDLAQQRCFNHALREAVARCPECRRFYCRECVTEHEDKIVCAPCLRALAGEKAEQRRSLGFAVRGIAAAAALTLLWSAFYVCGQGLLLLPDSFHQGELWQPSVWEEE